MTLSTRVTRKSKELETRLTNGWYHLLYSHAVRVSIEINQIVRQVFNFALLAFGLYGSCRFASPTSDGLENIRSSASLRATFRRLLFNRNHSILIPLSGNDVNIFHLSYPNRHNSIRVHL